MRRLWARAALAVAMIVAATATSAANGDDPLNDPYVQKTLRAMHDASTWYPVRPRDAQWKATVSVGKLEEAGTAPAKSEPAPAQQH